MMHSNYWSSGPPGRQLRTKYLRSGLPQGSDGRLQYDATTGQHSYIWKTDKAWAGSGRQLMMRLVDGTEHIAGFQFR